MSSVHIVIKAVVKQGLHKKGKAIPFSSKAARTGKKNAVKILGMPAITANFAPPPPTPEDLPDFVF